MKKLIYSVLFCLTLFNSCTAQSYNFKYRQVPKSLSVNYIKYEDTEKINLVDLSKYLSPLDCKGDCTSLLQNLIYKYKKVILPNFSITINKMGITLPSNCEIFFQPKSVLIMEANNQTNYQVLRIHNVENIKLSNPTIIGDKRNHIGNKGEWGMGISIKSSKNIAILNSKISECWGDGIYIAGNSKNIKIKYGLLNNNRRNNISIISVNSLSIEKIILANANGTHPQSGILFEPNSPVDKLNDIQIKDVLTFNNAYSGIGFTLKYAYDENKYSSKIVIDKHIDYYSKYAFASELKPKKGVVNKRTFKIEVNDVKWYDSFDIIKTDNYFDELINISINKPFLKNQNKILNLTKHRSLINNMNQRSIIINN